MVFLTGEVAFPLHSAIILAFGLIQYDTHPFPRGKEGGSDISDGTTLTLPRHLHCRANLEEDEDRLWVNAHILKLVCVFLSMYFFILSVFKRGPTFGGLLLSTVPALLILLISALVSWRIWGIHMGGSRKKDEEMMERGKNRKFVDQWEWGGTVGEMETERKEGKIIT